MNERNSIRSEGYTFEAIDIYPATLQRDNASEAATKGLERWELSRKHGNLTGIRKCGDARPILPLPESSAAIGSIATGGDHDSYSRLYNFPAFRDFIAIGHFDGDTLEMGAAPTGCGGLSARAEIDAGRDLDLADVQEYIKRGISHPDVLVQTFISASNIAKRTDKDVLATVEDHLDGSITPFAVFSGKDSRFTSSINPEYLLHKYDPKEIYKYGRIPHLSDKDLPAHFQHILTEYADQQATLLMQNARLPQYQKVQNPAMVYFSTDIRPVELRFPGLASKPNRIFQLNVPRSKIDNNITIDDDALENVIQQAEYPIQHAIDNRRNPIGAFSRTHTFYVETGDLDKSKAMAERLLARDWMKKWMKIPGNELIIARSRAGKIAAIAQYSPDL